MTSCVGAEPLGPFHVSLTLPIFRYSGLHGRAPIWLSPVLCTWNHAVPMCTNSENGTRGPLPIRIESSSGTSVFSTPSEDIGNLPCIGSPSIGVPLALSSYQTSVSPPTVAFQLAALR